MRGAVFRSRLIVIEGFHAGNVPGEFGLPGGIGIGGGFSIRFFHACLFLAGTGGSHGFGHPFHEGGALIGVSGGRQFDFRAVGQRPGFGDARRTVVVEAQAGVFGPGYLFSSSGPGFRLKRDPSFAVVFIARVAAVRTVDAGDAVLAVVFVGGRPRQRRVEGFRFAYQQPAAVRVLPDAAVAGDRLGVVDASDGFDAFREASVEAVGFNGADDDVVPLAFGDADSAGFFRTGDGVGRQSALLARDDGGPHAVFFRGQVGGGFIGFSRYFVCSVGQSRDGGGSVPFQDEFSVRSGPGAHQPLRGAVAAYQVARRIIRIVYIAEVVFRQEHFAGGGGHGDHGAGFRGEADVLPVRVHQGKVGGGAGSGRRQGFVQQLHPEVALAGDARGEGRIGTGLHVEVKRGARRRHDGDEAGRFVQMGAPGPRAYVFQAAAGFRRFTGVFRGAEAEGRGRGSRSPSLGQEFGLGHADFHAGVTRQFFRRNGVFVAFRVRARTATAADFLFFRRHVRR